MTFLNVAKRRSPTCSPKRSSPAAGGVHAVHEPVALLAADDQADPTVVGMWPGAEVAGLDELGENWPQPCLDMQAT
jgi:hypothetical protein